MNHLDLFSGIGGFSLAAKWSGFKTIQFVEIDKFCQKVLQKNFPGVPIHDDIKTFHFNDKVDLLTGGFPCQPFSVAGKKLGIKDDRYLWPDMLRIIRECRPHYIIAENVPGIVPLLDTILQDLESEAYSFRTFNIPASLIGAPHKRERIWIIANRDSERCSSRNNNRETRSIEINQKQYLETIQQEWPQFQSLAWKNLSADEWLQVNAEFMRRYDGLPFRMDRIKALGNAIVPQVIYPIMKLIFLLIQGEK